MEIGITDCPKCGSRLFRDQYTKDIFCLVCAIRGDDIKDIKKLADAYADRFEDSRAIARCSFCGKQRKIHKLKIHRGVLTGYICDECLSVKGEKTLAMSR